MLPTRPARRRASARSRSRSRGPPERSVDHVVGAGRDAASEKDGRRRRYEEGKNHEPGPASRFSASSARGREAGSRCQPARPTSASIWAPDEIVILSTNFGYNQGARRPSAEAAEAPHSSPTYTKGGLSASGERVRGVRRRQVERDGDNHMYATVRR